MASALWVNFALALTSHSCLRLLLVGLSWEVKGLDSVLDLPWLEILAHQLCKPGEFLNLSALQCPHPQTTDNHRDVELKGLYVRCVCICAKSLQLCLTLCDPMDCSPPGSSFHEILQARILEWVAISTSRRISQPRDWTQVSRILGTDWAMQEINAIPYNSQARG